MIRRLVPVAALWVAAASAQLKVPVWVEAPEGGYRSDIASKQWQAWVNDRRAPVRGAWGPNDNLVVLLVSDLTGDLARVEALRAALPEALGKLGPRHFVGLLGAQDGLSVLADPTPDRAAIV